MNLDFTGVFVFKKTQISNLIKIRPVGGQLFHTGGQTDTNRRMEGQTDKQRDMTKFLFCFFFFFFLLSGTDINYPVNEV